MYPEAATRTAERANKPHNVTDNVRLHKTELIIYQVQVTASDLLNSSSKLQDAQKFIVAQLLTEKAASMETEDT
jgi:hypothetical protein